MPLSFFESCDESCGWVAAGAAALSIGSYGVPIKETLKVEVHPLVLQSYKTMVVFICFWLVLFMGETVRWTSWGLVSGFLWVLGGTCGIYGIRNAGMAIAAGTWASVMVMINFTWGILIFHEPIHNFTSTCCAFVLLGIGLVGMSRYSDPNYASTTPTANATDNTTSSNNNSNSNSNNINSNERIELTVLSEESESTATASEVLDRKRIRKRLQDDASDELEPLKSMEDGIKTIHAPLSSQNLQQLQQLQLQQQLSSSSTNNHPDPKIPPKDRVVLCRRWALTRRQLGVLAAVMNGMLAGSSLIPLHYAKADGNGGATYMLSYSIGSFLANCFIWMVYYLYSYYYTCVVSEPRSFSNKLYAAWEAMPKWHFSQLWLPGVMAGLLLSIGTFGSITTVTFLGQGVGNSLIQSKILISGLWGICYYKEISARSAIIKWFLSASVAVSGILWLTYEHTSAVRNNKSLHHHHNK